MGYPKGAGELGRRSLGRTCSSGAGANVQQVCPAWVCHGYVRVEQPKRIWQGLGVDMRVRPRIGIPGRGICVGYWEVEALIEIQRACMHRTPKQLTNPAGIVSWVIL